MKGIRTHSRILVGIREMVLHGELTSGQRVREVQLASKLGAPSRRVREYLPILAQEGMLVQLETREYAVRAFTTREITDAIDVRGALEGLAGRLLAEQGPPRWLTQALHHCLIEGDAILARQNLAGADEARYGEMNRQFHSLIVRGTGSRAIVGAVESNNRIPFVSPSAIAFARMDLPRMYDFMNDAHGQHHAIVQALEQGQGQRVAALLSEHAYQTKARVVLTRRRVA